MINRRIASKGWPPPGIVAWRGRGPAGGAGLDPGSLAHRQDHRGALFKESPAGPVEISRVPYGAPTSGSRTIHAASPAAFLERCPPRNGRRRELPASPLGVSPFVGKRRPDEPVPPPTPMQTQLSSLFTHPPAGEQPGEDCLVLNIWTRGRTRPSGL